MALNVIIGKIIELDYKDELFEQVEKCPDATINICDPENTIFPKSAFRMGSQSFLDFWNSSSEKLRSLYRSMREYPDLDGPEVIHLKPLIANINKLPDKCFEDADTDRMKWFKYWSNKAVELYGDRAGIQFG